MEEMAYTVIRKILFPFDWLWYRITLLRNASYFGPMYHAGQMTKEKEFIRRKCLEAELRMRRNRHEYTVLEIGTLASQSAILWASVCKQEQNGVVFTIDTWPDDRIFRLFLHNIKTSNMNDYIFPIKCSSDRAYTILQPERFDFIYIDGDHTYTQFTKDVIHYRDLVKTGGILCGDDFELPYEHSDRAYTREHREDDHIYDPKMKIEFHPGISLCLYEQFGQVSVKHGFWAMRKTKKKWEQVSL